MKGVAMAASFTHQFELDLPLIQGPMGGVSGPELIAATANAGALGILPIWALPVAAVNDRIQKTQSLTNKPFAVNLRADLNQDDHIRVALDAGVTTLHLFWGDPSQSIKSCQGDYKLIATVWDEDSAKRALDAGASALIAQGVEAGGHVFGTIGRDELLQRLGELSLNVPLIAAGGIGDTEDIKRVIEGPASGVVMGTRFLATEESAAHPLYKNLIVSTTADNTVRTNCYDGAWPNAPHRVIRTLTLSNWEKADRPTSPNRPGEGDIILRTADGRELPRYFVSPPAADMSGELLEAALYAGTAVAKINDIPSVTELVSRLSPAFEEVETGGSLDS